MHTLQDMAEAIIYSYKEGLGEYAPRLDSLQRELNRYKELSQKQELEITSLKNQVAANHKALDEMVALTGKVDQNPQS